MGLLIYVHGSIEVIVLNILLRIHRKLKEVAVFRYIKKVDKDDGSVSILFSLASRFA